jgi:hypothetical protein
MTLILNRPLEFRKRDQRDSILGPPLIPKLTGKTIGLGSFGGKHERSHTNESQSIEAALYSRSERNHNERCDGND